MSQEFNKNNPEEVDLIRLLNYFKNGIKSIFRRIGNLIELVIQFILLLKKNWILVVSLVVLGAVYGKFISPMLNEGMVSKSYEMVVKTNPISNYELYALSAEISNQDSENSNSKGEGILLAKSLGISNMEVEAIPRMNDIVSRYYEQTETNTVRGYDTDTLFYQGFELKNFKSNMENTDYSIQKIKIKVKSEILPKNIQEKFLNYVNNLPGIKREHEANLNSLLNLEKEIKRNLDNIDTLLIAKAAASKNSGPAGSDQLLVNTASRGNVEADLLRYAEMFTKRLYGTQKMIAASQEGVEVVSNLRSVGENGALSNPLLKYTLFGFVLAAIIILTIQFNKYLEKYAQSRKNTNA